MNEAINICKNCGGVVTYDIKTHGLVCSYCGTVDPLRPRYTKIIKHLFTNGFTFPSLPSKFSQYKCPNCNSITDSEHNNVTNCPSCGASPLALVASLSVTPDGIIPFSLPKNEIYVKFKKWLSKNIFAPRDLKKIKTLNNLKCIYYPVYTFDYTNTYKYTATGITRTQTKNGDTISFSEQFSGTIVSDNVNDLISANKNLSTNEIKNLGPYNVSSSQAFNKKFLYGFYAPDIDISPTQAHSTMLNHIYNENERSARVEGLKKYDDVTNIKGITYLSNENISLIYLPVWSATYNYGGKNYKCLINGTNGQISGSAPISKWKVIGLVSIIIAIMTTIIVLFNLL